MNHPSGYIATGTGKLRYLQWGGGSRLLLAFHGYGQDAAVFNPLSEYLGKEYTILSFDLPYHGQSQWPDAVRLTKKDLYDLVITAMKKFNVEKISLCGNSMGSRVCLAVLENMPERIDKVALIAADGLTINFYYYFLTRTYIGKKMFTKMLAKPQWFFRLANWLNKKKLVNPARHRFVVHALQSETSRNFLQQVWPGMSDIIPSPTKLKRLIKQHKIPVSIFMGVNDRVIPSSIARNFKAGLDSVQLFVLEKGHRVFDHENAKQVAESLL